MTQDKKKPKNANNLQVDKFTCPKKMLAAALVDSAAVVPIDT